MHIYNFLNKNSDFTYVLIKKDLKFPYVDLQSDFDIITKNIELFEKNLNNYFSQITNYTLRSNKKGLEKIHLDILYKKKFLYKFDLISSIAENSVTQNNTNLVSLIVNEKCLFSFNFLFKRYSVSIPLLELETIIRLIELDNFPEKKHHKDFIDNQSKLTIRNINNRYSDFLKNNISK